MTSPDGLTCTEVQAEPVFASDQVPYVAEGDGADVSSVVVLDDSTWVFYFHRVSNNDLAVIGRASAPVPSGPWQVDPEPMLTPGGEGSWDSFITPRSTAPPPRTSTWRSTRGSSRHPDKQAAVLP